jgi:hypothetical protein
MTGCFAASSYQSARMTAPGPARATFGVASMGPADEESEERVTIVDMRVRKAMHTNRSDLGVAMTAAIGDGSALLNVGLEPRVAIVNNIIAVGVPMTWFVGAPVAQIAPGVVATIPVSRQFEVNAAARLSLVTSEYLTTSYPVYNLGIGLSEDLSRWAIRPEVGVARIQDTDDWLVQLGVGIEPPVSAKH